MTDGLVLVTPAELAALVEAAVRRALAGTPRPAGRLPLADAAAQAGATVRVLRGAIARGELPAVKAGRGYTLAPADLDAWLAGRTARPTPARAPDSPADRALERARAAGRLGRVGP